LNVACKTAIEENGGKNMADNYFEVIKEVIWDYTNDKTLKVEPDSVLFADLGVDSYELIEVVTALEEKYDIDINERNIKGFKTVRDMMKYLEANVPA